MRPLIIHRWYPLALSLLAGVVVWWRYNPAWATVLGKHFGNNMVGAGAFLFGLMTISAALLSMSSDQITMRFLNNSSWLSVICADFMAGIYGGMAFVIASILYSAGAFDFSGLAGRVFFMIWAASGVFMFLASIRVVAFSLGERLAMPLVRRKPTVGRKFM